MGIHDYEDGDLVWTVGRRPRSRSVPWDGLIFRGPRFANIPKRDLRVFRSSFWRTSHNIYSANIELGTHVRPDHTRNAVLLVSRPQPARANRRPRYLGRAHSGVLSLLLGAIRQRSRTEVQ